MLNKSPERTQSRIRNLIKRVETGEKTAESAEEMVDFYKSWEQQRLELEETDEWRINNMEYDLRSSKWICDKTKVSRVYAQNLYAAMCNRSFRKIDVIEILKESSWSCSWRSSGGIVADMREQGDYMDWYCSGIRGDGITDEEYNQLSKSDQEYYIETKQYVGESHVTDEIKQDLKTLGWMVLDED